MDARPKISPVLLSRDLRADGFEYGELVKMATSGELARIRRGAYTKVVAPDPPDQHLQLIRATLPQLADDACVSHQSAAVLHGYPSWPDQLGQVHVTRGRPNGGRRGRLVHVHPAPLDPADVFELFQIRVTSPARTVLDLARTTSFSRAVGVGDAALRAGTPPTDLAQQLWAAAGRSGVARARRVLAFVDGRAESFGESLSRVALHRAGLPAPQLQFEVHGRLGEVVARTDFAWEDSRTVGEFDGKVKYGRLLRAGETAGDVIYREKVREDMLRDLGWEVVRWTWADLSHPSEIAGRLSRAFARGTRR